MENFKRKVYDLEERVSVLETEKKGKTVHFTNCKYLTEEAEYETMKLDEFDTFRLVHLPGSGTNPHQYCLTNPTQELLELPDGGCFGTWKGYIVSHDKTISNYIQIQSRYGPDEVEKEYLIKNREGQWVPPTLAIKAILDSKFWEFSTVKTYTQPGHSDQSVPNWSRTLKFEFKHSYETIPHVSWMVTPIQEASNLKISINNITKKYVEFLFEYGMPTGKEESYTDQYGNILYKRNTCVNNISTHAVFHWSARGPIEQPVKYMIVNSEECDSLLDNITKDI